jgi:hypothetical protein
MEGESLQANKKLKVNDLEIAHEIAQVLASENPAKYETAAKLFILFCFPTKKFVFVGNEDEDTINNLKNHDNYIFHTKQTNPQYFPADIYILETKTKNINKHLFYVIFPASLTNPNDLCFTFSYSVIH